MKPRIVLTVALFLLLSALAPVAVAATEPGHEVWVVDQSSTYDSDANGSLDSGGTLYIFDGSKLAGTNVSQASPEVVPLGGAVADWVKQVTGSAPVRPHYITFNASQTHAIISFVGSGHVLIMNAATRTPVFVADVGAQAHTADALRDESYILVANQNGKLLQRINTDYRANTFTLDPNATLDLAAGTTPSGALKQDDGVAQVNVRPDNAPIQALPDSKSALAFITLRGGGLFVVNPRVTPMAIVSEYTMATVKPAGLFAIQQGDKVFFNSGAGHGGGLEGFQAILYRLPVTAFSAAPNLTPNIPAPLVVFDHTNRPAKDAHGLVLMKSERYLWAGDRAANRIIVVDTQTDTVVNEINLVGALSADPAPDLFGQSPSGGRVYVTLRGPNPLTGNDPMINNAKGLTPGLGVINVEQDGKSGTLQAAFWISHLDSGGVERADPHALAVRLRSPPVLTIQCADVQLCWNSESDVLYQVEYRSELTGNLWVALGNPVSGNGTSNCMIDSALGLPRRFYRVRALP